jgi:2-polyprenyl-3-methyl-5-hydroxy-6-metoxy-1,4-benzoquinol methylase
MEESFIHYSACPVCGSNKIKHALDAKDYTVSSKIFGIWECGNCALRFTQDVPAVNSIGQYYQSENYISHTDSSKGFINKIYHFVRRLTLGDKRRLILSATGLKEGKLLDIGAGTGAFVQNMQLNGWQTTGLEPDEETRKRAAALHKVNLLPADTFYTFATESFNVITMWHVLEHVHDLHNYIKHLKETLKPGGLIFVAVPNYTSYDGKVYNSYWAAYDVPRHLYHFSPESVKQLMNMHGLQVQSTRSMRYDSFYISFLSEKYKKGNPLRGFFVAFLSNFKAFVNKEHCSSIIYIIGKK